LLAMDWLCVVKMVFGCHNFCLFLKLVDRRHFVKFLCYVRFVFVMVLFVSLERSLVVC
jgi:hypothetical protein